MDIFIYGWNRVQIFFGDLPTWGGDLGPNLHPWDGFFWPWFFIILRNSHQDLPNKRVKLYFESTRSWSLSCSKIAVFLTNYLIEWVCVALLGLKDSPHADRGKKKISVNLLRSPWIRVASQKIIGTNPNRPHMFRQARPGLCWCRRLLAQTKRVKRPGNLHHFH